MEYAHQPLPVRQLRGDADVPAPVIRRRSVEVTDRRLAERLPAKTV
jgi:hypothetical protein